VILGRCLAQPLFNHWIGVDLNHGHGFFAPNGLGFFLALASFFVGVVAAQEQKRYSDGDAARSGEGALAMSVLSMTMACVFAIMEWLGEYGNETLGAFDKMFFAVAAIFAMVRHHYVEIMVHTPITSDLEEPLAPTHPPSSIETEKDLPLPQDVAPLLWSALLSLSFWELKATGEKMAGACQRYRVVHGIALASAIFSAFSLSLNLFRGNLPADSAVLPMSARAAGGAGLAVSIVLIIGTSSSIWVDSGHSGPFNDHSLRFVTSWKMMNLALKLIATFNPGKEQLKPPLWFGSSSDPYCFSEFLREHQATAACNSTCVRVAQLWGSCSSNCSNGSDLVGLSDPEFPDVPILKCFRPNMHHDFAYGCLVAATVCTLLLTLFLTFTNATKSEKQEQLQQKHIARPKSLTFGYFLVFFCSKLGLASLTVSAATGAQYLLLSAQVGGIAVGELSSFELTLPIIFALAMAGMLTNEFARLTEDPEKRFSAARSADGIRALADPIIVLSTPSLFFVWKANLGYGSTPGMGLLIASYCAMGVMLGAVLMVAGAGTGERATSEE